MINYLASKVALSFGCLALLMGCDGGKSQLDNPSRGTITVAADESFLPLVTQLTSAYAGIYPNVHFNVVFKPEQEAINMMLKDSARLVFATRKLTANERLALDNLKIKGAAIKIATDGVALIVNKANTDSLITMNELRDIFSGRTKQWAQLKGSNQKNPITLVFDNNNSSNLDFVLDTLKVSSVKDLRIFTTKSNREVIDFVRKNPSALGFIGVNWISDSDEPLSVDLARDLRVVGVSNKTNPTGRSDYFQPFQEDLGMQRYPLRRPVYILSRESHPGLGGGLINYITRDAGSLIVRKLGLWPAMQYNREVNLTK
ncbi:PstS family phosphate ABC transporter substrate-binding protein [Spirosoma utsteinense]|uniref:Phosphate transport system substrate-binding protein n=1 Tax=Spirosoma utsteinense TaxID=2585773 RepID=A0ABR6W761_9BACT|nr:substrate-binding domain-containing protein [Spirosoma utsteinense]MBC3784859.1 phosphate transport system substrate-binding protein [Spirosoma utsteinense]MBC3792419.1 phosphate transport system substrate-binding protein [Spirosoma utsteinense]